MNDRRRCYRGETSEQRLKFCAAARFCAPTPVTTLPVRLCLKNGFDPAKALRVGLYRLRSYDTGGWHRRIPRCRIVLQIRSCGSISVLPTRSRPQLNGRSSALFAVGKLHAPLHSSRYEPGRGGADRTRRRLAAHCRTARRLTLGWGQRTACSSSTKWAVKAPSGGIISRPCQGSSTWRHSRALRNRPRPARRSLRPLAAPKCSPSDDHFVGRHVCPHTTFRCEKTCADITFQARPTAAQRRDTEIQRTP